MSQTSDQTTIVISSQNSPLPSQDQQQQPQQQLQQQQQQQQGQQQQQKQHRLGWEGNKSGTLLVVATLITTLTYQIGSNPPGGFWQDDNNGHEVGSPIMRDKHRTRYWLFMTGAWVGFVDSMLLTLWLLIGMPVNSTRVRWSFIIAYSSLQLTYIAAVHGTPLVFDLVTWAVIVFILANRIGTREMNWLRCKCLFFFTEPITMVNPSA
ncbi:Caskin/Ankyrin repeat-containing protein [Dioscorea alata]|uniref:Caskin/Ankyrin repeat-containing protein n=1 Tax=Dioscorea alata TaxID=55571 RepID=A0ACB7WH97_DIOAL|nr:Caskin/Ankyrin repeat-containing protein [Dioscorea alata]